MQFGCAATIEDIDTLFSVGYDYVELGARRVCVMTNREFSKLEAKLSSLNLGCLGFNIYCPPEIVIAGPAFDLETVKKYAKKCLPYAKALGIRHVGVGSPLSRTLPTGFPLDLAGQQIRKFYDATADVFGEQGIFVCIEALGPCFCNYINFIWEAAEIVSDLKNPYLGLVPDFYNMDSSGEGDLDLSPYLPDIRHVHISDDDGHPSRRSFLKKERLPIHKKRLEGLFSTGYDSTVSVEIDVAARPEDAAETLGFLRQVYESYQE